MDVPTLIMGAHRPPTALPLLTSDVDPPRSRIPDRRAHHRRIFRYSLWIENRDCARAIAYAPYADLLWCENVPSRIYAKRENSPKLCTPNFPANCSRITAHRPSTGKKHLSDSTIASFPTRTCGYGIQIPIHHTRRIPFTEFIDVRTCAWLQDRRDGPPIRNSRKGNSAANKPHSTRP